MDVFLVPAGPDGHELYCEIATAAPDGEHAPTSLWGRAVGVFRRALAEGEAARARGADRTVDADDAERSWLRRTVTRKLAEAVAEQRLLWHLRRETAVNLVHPDDTTEAAALELMRGLVSQDRDKHRRWCVIDAVLTVASAPLALVPGPNFLAYYFIFRSVGHFLSMQGAQQGLSRVTWTPVPSPHLTAVRSALRLEKDARVQRIDEIAAALGLDRLGPFVEDVAER